ncbi:hypothetical protein RZ532_01025 [Nitratireductor aquimarinus]|uniref:hypothetical protein n=1 Tax=Nitratireductor aquimarinus TaxID=889300 RepID=UPI0029354671|nr:hypothetical protein [Nitratireductor aquimarinus]MDV2964543.1 hypothetical protein [Nitratireductor aquimarinus]
MAYTIWEFSTKRFRIVMTAEEEYGLDLSWDDSGEIREKIEDGLLDVFCAKCAVYLDGREISADYLGGCIYETADDFRDHMGLAAKRRADGRNYGSYFSDMVRTAIQEARDFIAKHPNPAIRAA